MHKLYDLKDKLVEELESYADNGKISPTDAEAIKYLASAADHIDNICERCEEDEMSYADGMGNTSYRYSRENRGGNRSGRYSNRGMVYARGRSGYSRRYSGADGEESIEEIKRDIQKLNEKLDQM